MDRIYAHFLIAPARLVFILQFFILVSASSVDVTIGGNTLKVCTTSLCDRWSCGEIPGDPTPCRCDYACEFYNDCCGDYGSVCSPMKAIESARGFHETVDALEQVDLVCVTPNADAEDAYWMIQSCPDTWKDSAVRYKCTSPNPSSPIDLLLLPVVHDEVTYRNLFCALCNGVELNDDISGWKIEFSCSNDHARSVESRNITLHDLINSENCQPHLAPPANVSKVSHRPCLNDNYIASCPTDSPLILQDGCMSFSAVFKDDWTGKFFKNPYCKMCNDGAASRNLTTDQHNKNIEKVCSLLDSTGLDTEPPSLESTRFGAESSSLESTRFGAESSSLESTGLDTEPPSLESTGLDTEPPSLESTGLDTEPPSLESTGLDTEPPSLESTGLDTEPPSLESTGLDTEPSSLESTRFGAESSSLESTRFGAESSSLESTRFGAEPSSLESTRFGAESSGLAYFGSSSAGSIDKDIDIDPLTPISVLVDFSRNSGVSIFYSENIVVKREVSCNDGEVFDLASEGCVAVTCTKGYTLSDDSCVRDSPPFNLTCGNEGTDLEIYLTVLISTETNMTCLLSDRGQLDSITTCIATSLSLPNDSIVLNGQVSMENNTGNSGKMYAGCIDIPQAGNRSLEYRLDTTAIAYSELEDSIDESLLYLYQSSLGCPIQSVEISQRCVAVEGLHHCPNAHKKLSDPTLQILNGTSFVYDNQTGSLYHPYETESSASYDRTNSSIPGFHKKNIVRVCDRGNNIILSCPLISRNATFFESVTGKAQFLLNTKTGEILGPDEYIVTSDGNIQVCVAVGSGQNATVNDTVVKHFFRYDQSQIILSYVGVCFSLLALVVTFLTYCLFPDLRQCVGNKLIMLLCVALFAAQLFQLLNGLATGDEDTCMIVAVVGHFLWLWVFAMTTVLAVELDKTLGSNNFLVSSDSLKSLLKYSSFAFALAGVIVGICLGIHFTIGDEINFHYGSETLCWIGGKTANLIAFGGPLAIFLLVNMILFLHTVYRIRHVTKIRYRAIRHASTLKEKRNELRIYWKISTLLGFTWLFGFVAAFVGEAALWYVFIVLNSLQGLYIFLAFMVNKRVFNLWTNALSCKRRGGAIRSLGEGKRSNGKSTTLSTLVPLQG